MIGDVLRSIFCSVEFLIMQIGSRNCHFSGCSGAIMSAAHSSLTQSELTGFSLLLLWFLPCWFYSGDNLCFDRFMFPSSGPLIDIVWLLGWWGENVCHDAVQASKLTPKGPEMTAEVQRRNSSTVIIEGLPSCFSGLFLWVTPNSRLKKRHPLVDPVHLFPMLTCSPAHEFPIKMGSSGNATTVMRSFKGKKQVVMVNI